MDTPRLKTLDEIAIEKQTDRASVFTRTYAKPHDYARHYDKLFTPLRGKEVKLLEVGVGGGEGIRMWVVYFSLGLGGEALNSRFYGVDIVANTNEFDTPGKHGCYTFVQGDQTDPTFWKQFIAQHGADWDIIVDDGLHSNISVIATFNSLWQHVKPGGFYAIEDLACSYGSPGLFFNPAWPRHMEFLKGKLDELNLGSEIDSIYFAKELAVLRKAL